MEADSHLMKVKRCISNLPYNGKQKTSLISNDTVTSSTQLQKAPRREKVNNLNKSIQQQINKAKNLISQAKQKVENDETLSQNVETLPITLENTKQRNRILQINNFLKKPNAPRSNSHESFPTQLSGPLTPQSTQLGSRQSPKKSISPKKKDCSKSARTSEQEYLRSTTFT